MAGIRVIEAAGSQRPKRRIGVYVRVSTDSSDQQNSYASQISYYTAMIEKHPEWALVDIYADEGISGTSMEQRNEFQRLMRDARKGMLDEVFTKSISRFARNTRDSSLWKSEVFPPAMYTQETSGMLHSTPPLPPSAGGMAAHTGAGSVPS